MVQMMAFNIYSTQWGTGAVVYNRIGLTGVLFPYRDERMLEEKLHERYERVRLDETIGAKVCSTLELYFSGERVQFNERTDLSCRSQFDKTVYDKLKAIPYGETITYGTLAELCGSPHAARAVGNAMRKNSTPIVIPCHRVLKSDGGIGGWSGKPGWKERLLAIEGSKLIVDNVELI
jgi:methylated-DNA-[protein]-cysteine S-methyltransferase